MNYVDSLIAVADDCPVRSSAVPAERGEKKTVAVLQYEMLAGAPYTLTQEDVQFESWLRRQDRPGDLELELTGSHRLDELCFGLRATILLNEPADLDEDRRGDKQRACKTGEKPDASSMVLVGVIQNGDQWTSVN